MLAWVRLRSIVGLVAMAVSLAPDARAACDLEPDREREPASVVLVVADTVRRDRTSLHGGPARTPHLDALATDHWAFERASSQAPWTKPSIATLFTSLHPSQHRVSSDPQLQGAFGVRRSEEITEADVLSSGFHTLAESARQAGLRTGAIVPNPWMVRRYGFAQGFDHYDDSLASWEAGGGEVTRAALAWLADVPEGQPFLLYVHYMDAHRPYARLSVEEARAVRPAPDDRRTLRPRDVAFAKNHMRLADGRTFGEAGIEPSPALLALAYDRGVEAFDAALGGLLAGLRARGDWSRTAMVVTSDHGEGLFEHGYGNHGGGLFEVETAIPLVVRWPGGRPERARPSCGVGLVDVMPTLCDGLGLSCPAHLAGRSIFAAGEPRPGVVSEGVMTRPENRALRTARHKIVYEPQGRRDARTDVGPWSLFDLQDDPGEQMGLVVGDSVAPAYRELFDRMKTQLRDAVPAFAAPSRERAPVDPALEERLRALGYTE